MNENINQIRLISQPIEYKDYTTRLQKKSILLVNVEKLSDLLRRRLNELKLSNADLARLTGLSRSYIGNMVNETAPTQSGQYQPSPDVVAKLAQHLSISELEILNSVGFNVKESFYESEFLRFVRDELKDAESWSQNQKDLFLQIIKVTVAGIKAQTGEFIYQPPAHQGMPTMKQSEFMPRVKPAKRKKISQQEFIVEDDLIEVEDKGTIDIDKNLNKKVG